MLRTDRQQTIMSALGWELLWFPVEIACTAVGLWLWLGLHWMTIGSFWLWAFLAIDFIVRYQHYSKLAPTIHGK
jgi:hypothetical protein